MTDLISHLPAFTAGLLMSQPAWAMNVIRVAGATYLAWLAWTSFRKAPAPGAVTQAVVPAREAARLFLSRFLLQITNSKAIVFLLAIAAIGATPGGNLFTHLAFVAGAFAISFLCHAARALPLFSAIVRAAWAWARRGIEVMLDTFISPAVPRMATARD
ncbi:LysE type translocator [Palleronia aestuarii]|uniref:LysE type translocator n=1 Tax=Palleronia aestuarii TaxID=568105 RepID=A0A2W7NJX3_9RHOB|nr:LysE family transporter [Palleronia aestuarii]PZX18377.1 LysE type translocator [Palleronia aestuarii]